MTTQIFSEKAFEQIFRECLGGFYPRALQVFRECGPSLSHDVANTLWRAVEFDGETVHAVLVALENLYVEHLMELDPKVRRRVDDELGPNTIEEVFQHINTYILGDLP